MNNVSFKIFSCFLLLFSFFAFDAVYAASYQTVAPGDTVTLGEFVFEDDFTPSTADCTITINDPSGTQVVSPTVMTERADGWHFYNHAVATNAASGTWSSIMSCGSAGNGDLVKADKSFIVEERDWTVVQSDIGEVLASTTYRTKVFVYDSVSQLTDSFAVPKATIYDASRNIVIQNVAMTKLSTGTYELTHSVSSSAATGIWETVVSTEVESGKVIATNDFWEVEGSPARVTINSIEDNTVSSITANFVIANEGTTGNEYQYEYCVVTTIENVCGGGNDVAYAMSAEFIETGVEEEFNKELVVNNTGMYLWKVVVYWGTEKSVAVLQFDAVSEGAPAGGGGGGGGGGGSGETPPAPSTSQGTDFNLDGSVNSIDFSILLFFWKTDPPFSNPSVDINKDGQVNSIDFSILLFQWGS